MKDFFYGLFSLSTAFIMWIPFHFIRNTYLRCFLNKLGKKSEICRNVDIRSPHRILIGNNTTINKNVVLDGRGGTLKIGNNVDIAQDCRIWTLQHDYNSPSYKAVGDSVEIKDYVWIASGATVLPGVTIGEGAVVGTCSVVTKNVPPYTVVAGIPAKCIGTRQKDIIYNLGEKRWFH